MGLQNNFIRNSCTAVMITEVPSNLPDFSREWSDTLHSGSSDGDIKWSREQEWVQKLHACLLNLCKLMEKRFDHYELVFTHNHHTDRVLNTVLLAQVTFGFTKAKTKTQVSNYPFP